MIRRLDGGYELDDDAARVDVDAVFGFARAFSDGVALAYLADVYVLPEHRGRRLGVELVREIVENGPLAGVRWMLHTRDAHDLHARFGFDRPSERVLERPPA